MYIKEGRLGVFSLSLGTETKLYSNKLLQQELEIPLNQVS